MNKNESNSARIKGLGVGDKVVFPIEKLTTIRSIASQLSLSTGNRYVTKADGYERTITVRRVE